MTGRTVIIVGGGVGAAQLGTLVHRLIEELPGQRVVLHDREITIYDDFKHDECKRLTELLSRIDIGTLPTPVDGWRLKPQPQPPFWARDWRKRGKR